MLENKEIWKDIKGYEGLYQVSNWGRIWSSRKQRYMKPYDNKGYLRVDLIAKNGKRKQEFVHRLVALTFIDNPENYTIVNHKDENKTNNCVENLEWCSREYNNNYGTRNQRIAETMKYKIIVYDKNDNEIGYYNGTAEAAEALGVHKGTVRNWIQGRAQPRAGYRLVIINGTNQPNT